ncbi:MAG: OmpA family protein [Bacteroidetes bacterium]|nr:OmpA family protein [Bacteroidota bacterium]
MKLISFLVLLHFTVILAAQSFNLVLNPSFENFKPKKSYPACTYSTGNMMFNNTLQNWGTFPECTPDLVVWNDSCHFPKPHSGEKAVGILTYLPAYDMGRGIDFHEFIQGKLSKPLEKGKEYTFAFYIQLGKETGERHIRNLNANVNTIEVIPLAAGSLGIYFSEVEEKYMTLDVAFPQLVWYDPIETKPGEWLLLSKTFKAERPYQYFTIGNFTNDNNTATNLPNNDEVTKYNLETKNWQLKKRRVGYYLLDDFWLGEGPPPAPSPSIAEELKKSKTYTFRNVNFESGKAELLPTSMPELDGLLGFLKENKEVKVEIGGHTDDVGDAAANQILSESRAQSVVSYLISNGIEAKRVVAKGFGESQPVAPNETAEGRLKNRRVECKVR